MPNIPTRKQDESASAAFYSYGITGPDPAVAAEALEAAGAVQRSAARTRYADIEPGVSVREGMDRLNYEFFRPGEHIPTRKNEVIRVAENVYRGNGIVKFVVDMMADFVTQGMEVHHPSARWERTYRHWWKKVRGRKVSERMASALYRHGVACVKRNFSVLNQADLRDLDRGAAARDLPPPAPPLPDDVLRDKEDIERDVKYQRSRKPGRNRIPTRYTFLNPMTVELIGGELSLFADASLQYGLKVPDTLIKAIRNAKTVEEKMVIANMPSYITDAIGTGRRMIPLDPEKVSVHHYKKDDYKVWADPLVLSVLKDIILYEKMKDSDRAALDGAIRSVRLWRLGLPEHKLQPGKGAFLKLRDQLLANNGGGGSMDLIWDATLDFKETSTDVYRYLGSAKYEPVLQAIYAGLGVPQNLVGGKQGSMTGDALNLRTLVERLQYVQAELQEFWEREFFLLQQAFGHRKPARLKCSLLSLSDQAAEQMVWLNLFDRNVVTTKTLREKFGLLDDVENGRMRQEYKEVESGGRPAKIGPFAEAQPHPDQLLKAAMQQGTIAPTEAGANPKPRKKGDRSLLDRQEAVQEKQMEQQAEHADELHRQKLKFNEDAHRQKLALRAKQATQKGQPGQGRPKNSKDLKPRKARTPQPRTSASAAGLVALQARGRALLRRVADAVTPAYLAGLGKKTLRSLTAAQAAELERRKFAYLCLCPPEGEVDVAGLVAGQTDPPRPSSAATAALDELTEGAYRSLGVEPTADEARELFVAAYAVLHADAA